MMIEPMPHQQGRLLDFDAGSDQDLKWILEDAARSGLVRISKPFQLLGQEPRLLAFKALYQGRYPPASEAERKSMLAGYVAVRLDSERLLDGVLASSENQTVSIIYSGLAIAEGGRPVDFNAFLPVFVELRPIAIYGQNALVRVTRQTVLGNIRSVSLMMAILVPGIIMSLLIPVWRRHQIGRLREARFQEVLHQDQKRYENLVESEPGKGSTFRFTVEFANAIAESGGHPGSG